jgi:hypothetical protein
MILVTLSACDFKSSLGVVASFASRSPALLLAWFAIFLAQIDLYFEGSMWLSDDLFLYKACFQKFCISSWMFVLSFPLESSLWTQEVTEFILFKPTTHRTHTCRSRHAGGHASGQVCHSGRTAQSLACRGFCATTFLPVARAPDCAK